VSSQKYVGRLIFLSFSKRGEIGAAYRLASKSFPHRLITLAGDLATVRPKPGFELEAVKKGLLPYYCLGIAEKRGILTANGRHFPRIDNDILRGRDAAESISAALEHFGPEDDILRTPRICGFISEEQMVLGIVSERGLETHSYPPRPGSGVYLSTYIRTDPDENLLTEVDFLSPIELARYVHEEPPFNNFSSTICTVSGVLSKRRFNMALWP